MPITVITKEQCCVKCSTPRSELKETPFIHSFKSDPWPIICRPCRELEINKQIKDFQESEPDTSYLHNPVCPYCGHEHQDAWEWRSDSSEVNCGNCDTEFHYERIITVEYTTKKIN